MFHKYHGIMLEGKCQSRYAIRIELNADGSNRQSGLPSNTRVIPSGRPTYRAGFKGRGLVT